MKFSENRQYINLGKYKKKFRPIFITYANTAYLRTIAVKLTAFVLLVFNKFYFQIIYQSIKLVGFILNATYPL